MKIISLGGVGGCDLAQSLRDLNQPTYPYDWLITSQSFIIKSFNNFDNFFIFDEKYIYDRQKLLDVNKKAIMLHDFHNFSLEKNEVILKYNRRFERLNNDINGNEEILFVRIYDNLEEKLQPLNYYNDIFVRDEEDISKWNEFISKLSTTYNKKIILLLITSNKNICNDNYSNIIIYFTKKHKDSNTIREIIIDTLRILSFPPIDI